MPLKSRAIDQRAARAAAQPADEAVDDGSYDSVTVEVQPRRGTAAAAAPSEPQADTEAQYEQTTQEAEDEADSGVQAGDDPAAEQAPPEPVRRRRSDAGKPRAPRAAPAGETEATDGLTPTAMRARMRELEVLHKETLRRHKAELQELAREHQRLAMALSRALFRGEGDDA